MPEYVSKYRNKFWRHARRTKKTGYRYCLLDIMILNFKFFDYKQKCKVWGMAIFAFQKDALDNYGVFKKYDLEDPL